MTRDHRRGLLAAMLVAGLIMSAMLVGCGGGGEKAPEATSAEQPDAQPVSNTGPYSQDFAGESAGQAPKAFVPVVGNWVIAEDEGNLCLAVDGTKWKKGDVSPTLAEAAKAVYPNNPEFAELVGKHSDYPFSVVKDVDNFKDGEISFRYKSISGVEDQAAGILFDLKPNGDYLTARANPNEGNTILFEMKDGVRTKLVEVKGQEMPKTTWTDWRVVIEGTSLKVFLNGSLSMETQLKKPVDGKVGIWSKADSHVLFDDYKVTAK